MNIKLETYSKSITGMIRKDNQDSLFVSGEVNFNNGIDSLCAVADGMGGLDCGSLASKIAIDSIYEYLVGVNFLDLSENQIFYEIKNANLYANSNIFSKGLETNKLMGTTLTYFISINDTFYISHIGDTRAYVLKNDGSKINLEQKTVDDNMANRKNVLTKYLGGKENFEPYIAKEKLNPGDIIILASDGFYNSLNADDIINYIKENKFENLASNLVNYANEKNGSDNITVIISKIKAN
tara:strand:- start:529 stop:1245 length:717 start_codon:yes stop_codon:yes gene_type:complete